MTQNINQFKQSPILGELGLQSAINVKPVKYDPASVAGDLIPGNVVKIVDVVGSEIIVDKTTTDLEQGYGVVLFNPKKNIYVAGEHVEIACVLTTIFMNAGAAIARGANVEYDVSENEVITSAGVNAILGIALDKASGADELIRVEITPRLANAVQAAITKPTGGATIDAEARTAIDSIIDALQAYGITL